MKAVSVAFEEAQIEGPQEEAIKADIEAEAKEKVPRFGSTTTRRAGSSTTEEEAARLKNSVSLDVVLDCLRIHQ